MPFYDYVRVQTQDGTKFSVIASAVPEGVTVLDEPATASDGTPNPPEYPKPATGAPGPKAKSDKEND